MKVPIRLLTEQEKEINQTLSDFWNFKIDYNKIYSEEE